MINLLIKHYCYTYQLSPFPVNKDTKSQLDCILNKLKQKCLCLVPLQKTEIIQV